MPFRVCIFFANYPSTSTPGLCLALVPSLSLQATPPAIRHMTASLTADGQSHHTNKTQRPPALRQTAKPTTRTKPKGRQPCGRRPNPPHEQNPKAASLAADGQPYHTNQTRRPPALRQTASPTPRTNPRGRQPTADGQTHNPAIYPKPATPPSKRPTTANTPTFANRKDKPDI